MKRIHVCLVSDQPIPNLTTVFQFKPDRVVLLYTRDMRRQKDRLEQVIVPRGIAVEEREIEPYDLNNVITVCEQLFRDCSGCEVSLNITGGTKIGTVGTFQSFFSTDRPIWYVNTRDNEIIQIAPAENRQPIEVRLHIKDYLAAYGFSVADYCRDDRPLYARKEATGALLDLAIRSERAIGALNRAFPGDLQRAPFPLRIGPLDPSIMDTVPVLERHAIARGDERNGLIVPNLESANYLRGFWFEEHLYMSAKGLGVDEIKLNVTGQWDAPGRGVPKNEFDVMIAKGNRLFYISCKTANPNRQSGGDDEGIGKEYLYELDSLGDRALGLFGKKLLASSRTVTNEYVKKRAAVMGIPILDKIDLPTLKGKIQQWLNA